MVDLGRLTRFRRAFADLLGDLSTTWPGPDVDFVREEVGYGEYDDALENLIALGLRKGKGFTADQVRQIEFLASEMDMGDSLFLVKLRQMPT